MLYAMLAACATLTFVLALAVPHTAKVHRLVRLFRAQQEWAERWTAMKRGKWTSLISTGCESSSPA